MNYKNKFNFFSPVINKNNYCEHTTLNKRNNRYYDLWINNNYNNYNSMSEKRYIRNIYYHDKVMNSDNDSLVRRTSLILNKNENRIRNGTIYKYTRYNNSNSNPKKIFYERREYGLGSNTWRSYRTPSPNFKEYISESQKKKIDTNVSRINLCRIYKNKKYENKKSSNNNYNKVYLIIIIVLIIIFVI